MNRSRRACRSAARGFDKLNPNGYFKFKEADSIGSLIAGSWSLATALSLMAWYVFAPQCISTIAAVRRETNGWRYPLLMVGYLFAMAYAASFVTYRVALALGGG